jgi:N-acetylglucosamine-6-phosphate deacetylase
MPQLHHRDPSIIGLLGAFESATAYTTSSPSTQFTYPTKDVAIKAEEKDARDTRQHVSEALRETATPPQTPLLRPTLPEEKQSRTVPVPRAGGKKERVNEQVDVARERKSVFERPYYGIIVDGCHSHPHSVRVRDVFPFNIWRKIFTGLC